VHSSVSSHFPGTGGPYPSNPDVMSRKCEGRREEEEEGKGEASDVMREDE